MRVKDGLDVALEINIRLRRFSHRVSEGQDQGKQEDRGSDDFERALHVYIHLSSSDIF
jgi:hypothetical protein